MRIQIFFFKKHFPGIEDSTNYTFSEIYNMMKNKKKKDINTGFKATVYLQITSNMIFIIMN